MARLPAGMKWDGNNLIITGDVTAEQVNKAMADHRANRDQAFKDASTSKYVDKESVRDIALREQQTLKNPKKQRKRGRRTLMASSPLGASGSLGA